MNTDADDDPVSRRRFIAGTAGAGLAAVAGAGTAHAQEDGSGDNATDGGGGNESDGGGNETAGGGGGGGGVEEVSVVDNEFDPAQITIAPGTTVRWIWEGENQHNVNPSSQPDDANWEGHTELQSSGEYEHTFDVEGEYSYVCDPHVNLGMEGTVTVSQGGGGGGGPQAVVPDAAWTLLVATVAGMISTLSLAYGFMRYGGSGGPEQ